MSRVVPALCALLLITLASKAVFAADKSRLNTLMQEVQRAYKAMDTFQAAFSQTLTHKESNSFEVHDGELLFKKPLLVRWETARPLAELFLITDKEIWHYLPDEKLAYRYPPEVAQTSHKYMLVLTGQARLDQDFSVEEVGTEEGLLRLRLYPKVPTQAMVEAGIWIDPASYLIKKALSIDFFGNSNEVAFAKFNAKLKLDAKSFSFTPPKGVVVEDRRKGDTLEQMFK